MAVTEGCTLGFTSSQVQQSSEDCVRASRVGELLRASEQHHVRLPPVACRGTLLQQSGPDCLRRPHARRISPAFLYQRFAMPAGQAARLPGERLQEPTTAASLSAQAGPGRCRLCPPRPDGSGTTGVCGIPGKVPFYIASFFLCETVPLRNSRAVKKKHNSWKVLVSSRVRWGNAGYLGIGPWPDIVGSGSIVNRRHSIFIISITEDHAYQIRMIYRF